MSRCQPKILFDGDGINVSTCTCCKRIGLRFNNILWGYNRNEFRNFSNQLIDVEFDDVAMVFPDQEWYMVLKTGHNDLQLCLNRQEYNALLEALTESMLMLEIDQVLNAK